MRRYLGAVAARPSAGFGSVISRGSPNLVLTRVVTAPNDPPLICNRYIRVFELLVYLGIRAYSAILPRGLYYRNLSILEGPFCLYTTAFHRVSIEFPFGSSRDF